MANPEPVFAARGVQLTAPPRIMKEKHIKLKVWQGAAVQAAEEKAPLLAAQNAARNGAPVQSSSDRSDSRGDFRSRTTFDALGWHMAERLQQKPLLAGDSIDIAFTVGNNDHPEYGGLELGLKDLRAG
jgi:single-stranded-DNA-specific exonuclease